MQRWRGQDEIPTDWGRCVVTIGVFDGVHRGHQELINHAVKAGRSRGVPTVLMTFDPHPMEVVFPGSHPAQLTTLARRAELVEEMGIDVFLVMPFTSDFMKLTPERYIHELLVEDLHVLEVVVGENFTFGKKAAGNVEMLRKAGERFGFAVESMSLVTENLDPEHRDGSGRAPLPAGRGPPAGMGADAGGARGGPERRGGARPAGRRRGGGRPVGLGACVPHAARRPAPARPTHGARRRAGVSPPWPSSPVSASALTRRHDQGPDRHRRALRNR